jgi:hypothetical protein
MFNNRAARNVNRNAGFLKFIIASFSSPIMCLVEAVSGREDQDVRVLGEERLQCLLGLAMIIYPCTVWNQADTC